MLSSFIQKFIMPVLHTLSGESALLSLILVLFIYRQKLENDPLQSLSFYRIPFRLSLQLICLFTKK